MTSFFLSGVFFNISRCENNFEFPEFPSLPKCVFTSFSVILHTQTTNFWSATILLVIILASMVVRLVDALMTPIGNDDETTVLRTLALRFSKNPTVAFCTATPNYTTARFANPNFAIGKRAR